MKLIKWLFVMPMLCLLLILVPTGALADEIKDTSEGNVPVTIIDDTTGASPANGTVTLPDYIYYQNATYPYYVDRGDTVTLNVVPDEGYEIGDLRVTYKRIEAGSDLDLAFDEETSSFTLPVRGCVAVTIHVTFVRPGGVYGIETNIVERSSGRVTGNTVEPDKTTAMPGETVVFNVVMNPGTQFYDLGDDRSYPYVGYLAADGSHVYVDLDQVDEDTWSFVMPEHDVNVVCGFCFTDYSICFEATEELLKFNWMMVKNEAPRVYITEDSPGTAVEGDTIRLMTSFDQLSYPNYDFPYQITGMTLHYTLDGEEVTQELTCTHSDWYSNPAAEFTMPCADVTVSCSLERIYNVNTETDDGGMIVRSQRKALPGDVVTLSSEAYDPLMEFPVFTVIAANGDPVEVDENNSFVMPEGDVSVYVEFTPTHFPYISRTWNGEQLVEEELTIPGDYKFLSSNIIDLTEGWYIVRDTVTYGTRLKTSGTVNILLMDGSTLTANNGIYVREDSHLNIYTQAGDNGKLIAKSGSGAGIGGNTNACGGFVAIHGGVVEARGGDDCAGIGGGYDNESGMLGITINGGTVTARGGDNAAGIGGGQYNNYIGAVTIRGGVVNAYGGENGAGIGGGEDRSGYGVIITGGTVTANAGEGGAGIGGGEGGDQGGAITISGGEVTARGKEGGAGIGGGVYSGGGGNGYMITINGGKVTAYGGYKYGGIDTGGPGAGIGGGYRGRSGDITIHGGKVYAQAGWEGATGIGGGYLSYNNNILIDGGEVTATSLRNPFSEGESEHLVIAGTGIGAGSGYDQYGWIHIYGGTVYAYGGTGAGIGGGSYWLGGEDGGNAGEIRIRNAKVFASSYGGAGIGGGGSNNYGHGGSGGTIEITNSDVVAISEGKGAGIGGGNDGGGGDVTISGGKVIAVGGYFYSDGDFSHSAFQGDMGGQGEEGWALAQVVNYFICKYFFSAHYGGAGIGGGDEGSGCNVRILDGASVIASTGYKKAQPIGKGNDGYQSRSLEIYEDAKISYGSLANEETGELNVEGTALWSERYQVCRNKSTVLIEPCDHSEAEYEDCGRGHKMHCPSCEFDEQVIRDHEFSDDSDFCTLCGAKRILLSFEAGEGHGSTVNVFSGAGMQKMPEDLTFYAHFRNADNWIPAGFAIAGEDQTVIYRPGAELEVTEDTVFVAVYADPYQLWVGSTKVTPDNRDDVLGDGKVSYDPYTYTLHLDNPGPIPGVTRGNLIYGVDMPLTVTGTANFSEDTGNFSEYIYVMNGSVTLDGEFICTGSTHFGIAASDITIRGGSLHVDSPDYGLYSFGVIRIENEVERVQIDVGTNRAICLPYPEYGGVILGDHLYVKECVKEDGEEGDDIQDARHVVIEHGIPVKINGVSGSFNDKIKLNYYFDIPDLLLRDNDANVTLTNERTGESITLYINEVEFVADKGYKFSIPLVAKEAGDTITARVFDGDGNALMIRGNAKGIDYTETGVQYTLMDYFTWLETNGTESEKSVGKAAKDYCLAAQICFDYYAEGLSVSSAVDDVTTEMLSGYIAGREGKLPTGVSVRGIAAMLESDNTLRLYLGFSNVDPADFTYTIDGEETVIQQHADGTYYLALDEGVWSNHLQDTHTYSVSDGTNTYTITASVLTYARSCANKSNKKESNLGKSLYLYNQAAVSAFQ